MKVTSRTEGGVALNSGGTMMERYIRTWALLRVTAAIESLIEPFSPQACMVLDTLMREATANHVCSNRGLHMRRGSPAIVSVSKRVSINYFDE